MRNQAMMEKIAKDLVSLKREYEEGRVVISHKIVEAQDFIQKFSFQKLRTYANDDPAVLDEAKRQLRNGKSIVIVAHADIQEYELYQKDW